MASITTQNFSRVFNLVTGNFVLTDLTDYAGLGINTADVTGWYIMVSPDGLTFHTGSLGTPDFTGASPISNTIPIPLDINDNPQEGDYTITQYIRVVGGVLPGTYDLQSVVNYCPDIPTASVTPTVDCIFATVSVVDNTVVTDWTVNSRVFKLYNARPETTGSPYTTGGTLITETSVTTDIWGGTWTWTLAISLSRTFGSGNAAYSVTVSIEGTDQFEVNCEDLCVYNCKHKALTAVWTSNPTAQPSMASDYILATGYLLEIGNSVRCGQNFDIAADGINAIFAKYNITDDCSCNDETPIQPIGGTIPTISLTDAGSVVVTDLGGGSWLIALTGTAESVIANARNVIPVAGTGITVSAPSVNNATTPPTWSYTISLTDPYPDSSDYGNVSSAVATLTWSGGPVINVGIKTNYGTNFDNSPAVTPYFNGSAIQPVGWAGMPAVFRVSDFNTASGTNSWKAQVDVVNYTLAGIPPDYPMPVVRNVHRDADPLLDYFEIVFPTLGYGPFSWSYANLQGAYSELQVQITIES